RGLGKRILSVARSADLVLLILDVFQPEHQDLLKNELTNIGIRLDQNPPNIIIEKTNSGGISVSQIVKLTKMSEELLKDILRVYGFTNARVVIREDIDSEQLTDYISGNKTYAHSLAVINKIDLVDKKFLNSLKSKIKTDFVLVSADSEVNIEELKEKIYQKLRFIRIYMRPKGGQTDYKEPLITRKDSRIADVCNKLHRNLRKEFRYGLVWGKSVKFGGQRVGINHVLEDEDVLTIIKARGT
ncbi:MAG: TGS domain-containing protein, partial [Gallionellaceae bacterium]